jgi:phenylalanyl-tRNA synthetase beta chain
MKVLLSWLQEFVDIPVESRKLADDLTLVGLAVDGVEKVGDDVLLDLDITTNRVDCMNVYGVAREIAVLYRLPLRPLEVAFSEGGSPSSEGLAVEIDAVDLCPRFTARVLDVRMGPSPAWIRDRLEAMGVRSINNVVDLTNYVLLEMGQPTHAFDLDRVPGRRLCVRWAREGETLRTLDEVERRLSARMGVVAGDEAPLALAGIMGGASSEVSDETRTVALEAAYWDPLSVRRTAKALGMHTEASHRFERGADPEGPLSATARLAHLLQKIGAGSTRPGLIDCHPAPQARRLARLRPSRLKIVLGVDVPADEARRVLTGLGFGVGSDDGGGAPVEVPSWRGDVFREIDIVEEVGRHHGLDKIVSTLPGNALVGGLKAWQARERELRETVAGAGLVETIQYAFVSAVESAVLPGARVGLENPISEEQGILRASLVVPGLLGALRTNLRQGRRDMGFFEIGRVFAPAEGLPREAKRLGFVLSGSARPPHWSEKARDFDLFDGKGIVEAVFRRLGAALPDWRAGEAPSHLHPGQSAWATHGGTDCGHVGVVHPDVARQFEIPEGTVVGEIDLGELLEEAPPATRFRPLDRFPAVARDLSVVVAAGEQAGDLERAIRAEGGNLLRSATVVDRYDRPPVPAGKVSLTFSLVFQHAERTLTGDEVQEVMARVVSTLRTLGAEIRGE